MKCGRCQLESPTKLARCPQCGAWGTFDVWRAASELGMRPPPERLLCGEPVLDALVGGGWVASCLYRLVGDPGAGKSTAALDVATRFAAAGVRSAYLTAEEAVQAIQARAARLGRGTSSLLISEGDSIRALDDLPTDVRFAVIDSLSMIYDPETPDAPGSNLQLGAAMRHVAGWAKARRCTVLVIGHVNAQGRPAGTRKVEHLVDCDLRMRRKGRRLRVVKNRHGIAPRTCRYRHVEEGLRYELEESDDDATEPRDEARAERGGDRARAQRGDVRPDRAYLSPRAGGDPVPSSGGAVAHAAPAAEGSQGAVRHLEVAAS